MTTMSTAGNEHAVTFVDPAAALAASAAAAAAARRANAVPPLATPPAAHGGPIPYGAFLPPEEGTLRGHHATHRCGTIHPPRWDHPNWDQNPFEAFEAERHRRRRIRRSIQKRRSSNRYERGQARGGKIYQPVSENRPAFDGIRRRIAIRFGRAQSQGGVFRPGQEAEFESANADGRSPFASRQGG